MEYNHRPHHVTAGWQGMNGNVYLSGMGFDPAIHYVAAGYVLGWLHVDMTVDLTAQTIKVAWYNPDGPQSGTLGSFAIDSAFAGFNPDAALLWNFCGVPDTEYGYDNMRVGTDVPPGGPIPEPASILALCTGLVSVGGLALRRRRA